MLGLASGLLGGSAVSGFLPTDVSGIQLWLRNGVGVTAAQWNDSSGNNNHATQSAEGNQASVGGGGLDFEQSEGDHYDLTSAISIVADQGLACFLVCDIESYDSGQNCFLSATSSKFMEFQNNDRIRLNYTNDVTTIYFDTSNLWNVATGKFLVTITRNDSGLHTVYKNGSSVAIDASSTNSAGAGLTNPTGGSISAIGHREKGTPDRKFDGKIYELIFYNETLSTANISEINEYLTTYHGL
tara:strand:+ start:793 stop:1518 length:726 start_codon:yes stop_codon:yes gene_type:complete